MTDYPLKEFMMNMNGHPYNHSAMYACKLPIPLA